MITEYIKALHLANRIHSVANSIWLPLPLQWSQRDQNWKFHKALANKYFVTTLAYKLFIIVCCFLPLLEGTLQPGRYPQGHMQLFCLGIFTMLMLITGDCIVHFDGRELSCCINWSYNKGPFLIEYGSRLRLN